MVLSSHGGEAGRAALWTWQGEHAQVEQAGHSKGLAWSTDHQPERLTAMPVLLLVSLEKDIPLAP